MRILMLFAHPDEASYGAALHARALGVLRDCGHEVDDCDLYAEGFDPVLSREERRVYDDPARNGVGVATHVERLRRAEALVIASPVWNMGFPAILKGYLDRVFLPGVSFRMVDGRTESALHNITRLTAIMTYGSTHLRAALAGDPPRRLVKRVLRSTIRPGSPTAFLAHYDMNRSTALTRARFLDKVARSLREI